MLRFAHTGRSGTCRARNSSENKVGEDDEAEYDVDSPDVLDDQLMTRITERLDAIHAGDAQSDPLEES